MGACALYFATAAPELRPLSTPNTFERYPTNQDPSSSVFGTTTIVVARDWKRHIARHIIAITRSQHTKLLQMVPGMRLLTAVPQTRKLRGSNLFR